LEITIAFYPSDAQHRMVRLVHSPGILVNKPIYDRTLAAIELSTILH
jgi:hypothetical protein